MTTLTITRPITNDQGDDPLESSRSAQPIYSVLATIAYSVTTILIGVTSATAAVPSEYRVYSYEFIHHEIVNFEREVWFDRLKTATNILNTKRESSNHFTPSERIDLLAFVSDSRTLIAAHKYLLKEGDYLVTQWRSSKPKAKHKRLRSLEDRVTHVKSKEERLQEIQSLIDAVQDELDSQTFTPETFDPTGTFSVEVLVDQGKRLLREIQEFSRDLDAVVGAEPYSAVRCFELIVEANQLLVDAKTLANRSHSIHVEFPKHFCNVFAKENSTIAEQCRLYRSQFDLYEEIFLQDIALLESSIDSFESFYLQKPRRSMVF